MSAPNVHNLMVAPAYIDANAGIVHGLDDLNPCPELSFKLGGSICHIAGNQISGKQHKIDIPARDFLDQLAQDSHLNTVSLAAAVARDDESPRRLGWSRRGNECQEKRDKNKVDRNLSSNCRVLLKRLTDA